MAKLKPDDHLVLLSIGYWANFILPVDAATQIMALMVKSGATAVESTHVAGTMLYHPRTGECEVKSFAVPFFPDIPVDDEDGQRPAYFSWLKTKYELVGKGYKVESFTDYLKAKGEET